ncbi:hypothetical protein DNFV4_00033 [Nitrospira tepida]|uniref:Uncharacterized protein n=2 Tax=Nitrospira tepida TaxID=2973512 RepID=A0AA86K8B6_9BACT|nr:hypothetical protein DNFV4_00033 [Nitrospira tepida]
MRMRLLILAGLCLMATGGVAWAGETAKEPAVTKKYPPYPEVWGYELPWPEKNSRHSGIMIFKKDDGDYVAMYIERIRKQRRKNGSCCDLKYEHAGQSFFSGKKWDGKEVGDFTEQHREDRVPQEFGKPHPWILTDGSEVQEATKGASRCLNYLDWYLRLLDPDKKVIVEKHLIYLLERPIKEPVCYPSERNENLIGKQKAVTMRVQGVYPYIIPLEDGTFLLYDQYGNIIMRFDRKFNTKSELLNRKVFVVDRQALETFVLERVKQRNQDYNDQTLNDAVYEYVTNLNKAGAK